MQSTRQTAGASIYHRIEAKSAANPLSVDVQSYEVLKGTGLASVIAAVNREVTASEIADHWSKVTGNKSQVLAGSVRVYQNPTTRLTVRFIAGMNTISKEFSEENTKDMVLASEHTLVAANNDIWKIVGEGDKKRIVLTSKDNMEAIMAARKSTMVIAASSAWNHTYNVANGDYAAYVRPDYSVGAGFLLRTEGSTIICDRELGKAVEVNPMLITEAADLAPVLAEECPEEQAPSDEESISGFPTTANLSKGKADKVMAYYARIYKNRPEFFGRYETLVKGIGTEYRDVSTRPVENKLVKELM